MLNIFPQGLEGTLVIPIFIGLLVMAGLTEVLGWDFVGVVVPGYLASVCLFEPVVAGIVVVEALATWALAVALDRGLTASGVTYPVFGRDRFFLVLVAAVVVRIGLEGLALPALVAELGPRFPALQAHRHDLFGIGLVLVPLAANRLWTPGPGRGLFQLAVQTALVLLVLRLVLLPFTNFTLAGFDPSYDPMALAFLTSPRGQMALLITAALASWCNRRYGWDFHGILVPALLGLAVVAPIKLLATVIEAVLVMWISRSLLTLPRLRRVNVEGARRVLLCFSIGVAWKMLVARTALAHLPGYRPTDLLGFGYMLPSLLAERIWRARSAVLVLLPTLQTAALGFVLTTGAALGLAVAAPAAPPPPTSFASLPQAVLALGPRLRAAGGSTALAIIDGQTTPAAETGDGYHLYAQPWVRGLVALKPGAHVAWAAPLDEWAAVTAAAAARAGVTLALGPSEVLQAALAALGLVVTEPPPRLAGSAAPAAHSDLGWATLARRGIDRGKPSAPAADAAADLLRPLAPGAGLQLDLARATGPDLARAMAPYGVTVTATAEGAQLVEGAGWPTVVLRPAAEVVVSASDGSEWGSAGAAIVVCEALQADCVLGHDDDGLAAPLALALAERRGRPLVMVRGTSRPLGADALLVGTPELGDRELPAWLRPLADLLSGRLDLVREMPIDLGALRAFPPDAGRVSATALLWLSRRARKILGGADQAWWARPDIQALAQNRHVPVWRTDALRWVAAGRGAPADQALQAAEILARTCDVAQLGQRIKPARLALLVDDTHALVGFAVEQGSRRALVMAGDRRDERAVIEDSAAAAAALRRGTRTWLARGATP